MCHQDIAECLQERIPKKFRKRTGREGRSLETLTAPVMFTLPSPPSVNEMYCQSHGRRVLIRKGREYKRNAASIAEAAGARPVSGDVCVTIEIYRKRRAGDLDNTLKIILDSLKGVAWIDDSQVKRIVAERFEDKGNPRAEVMIWKPEATNDMA